MASWGWGKGARGAGKAGDTVGWEIDWFGDPWIRWFLGALLEGSGDPQLMAQLSPSRRDHVLACLGHDDSPYSAAHAAALYQRSPSPESASILATVMVREAWRRRGRRPASAVSREDFEAFHTMLGSAEAFLADAVVAWPHHAPLRVAALDTARGLGAPIEERIGRWNAVAKIEPHNFAGAHRTLQSITRKWGGSHELAAQFAELCAQSPEGSSTLAMFPTAYIEMSLDDRVDLQEPHQAMTENLRQGLARLLAGVSAAPEPDQIEALERFVFAFRPVIREDGQMIESALNLLGERRPDYPASMWLLPSRRRKKVRAERRMQSARLR